MSLCVDIAWDKPSGAALEAAGVTVASLYLGQDSGTDPNTDPGSGKNMTLSVVQDYTSHGVAVLSNFEYGAQQMLGGAAQGAVDARLGLSQKRACGIPDSRPTIYSADWAASVTQIANCVIPYLVAARGVTGAGTVGVYGSYYVVKAVADYWAAHYPGEKIWLWQTVAWSNGLVDPRIDFYQNGKTVTIAGVVCDVDEIRHADAGQYPAPVVSAPTPIQEDEQMIIIQFNADPADPSAGSGIFLLSGGKLLAFANANTALAFKNQLALQWITVTDGPTLSSFIAASNGQTATVTIDSSQLAAALAADLPPALEDPTLLADQGKAYAHADAVQEHNDTPAS
jgi:hypothetical protein